MVRKILIIFLLFLLLLSLACQTQPQQKPTVKQETQKKPEEKVTTELHGVGFCDTCHQAPKLLDMRAGLHKIPLREKNPEQHKQFCQNCHKRNDCSKCHEPPKDIPLE